MRTWQEITQEWEEFISEKRYTKGQVRDMNDYQFISQDFHPLTCPRSHAEHIRLVATRYGWLCPAQNCDYVQYYK